MKCESYQDQFVEYLLGELSSRETSDIERHLESGCEECNQEVDAIRCGVELVFETTPQAALPEPLADRYLDHALHGPLPLSSPDASLVCGESQTVTPRIVRKSWNAMRVFQCIASTAAGFLLIVVLDPLDWKDPIMSKENGAQIRSGSRPPAQTLGLDTRRPSDRNDAVSFVAYNNRQARREGVGYLLLDETSREIHILGHSFSPLRIGEKYTVHVYTEQSVATYPIPQFAGGVFQVIVPFPTQPIVRVNVVVNEHGAEMGDENVILSFAR